MPLCPPQSSARFSPAAMCGWWTRRSRGVTEELANINASRGVGISLRPGSPPLRSHSVQIETSGSRELLGPRIGEEVLDLSQSAQRRRKDMRRSIATIVVFGMFLVATAHAQWTPTNATTNDPIAHANDITVTGNVAVDNATLKSWAAGKAL